jgi:hypothetical protein
MTRYIPGLILATSVGLRQRVKAIAAGERTVEHYYDDFADYTRWDPSVMREEPAYAGDYNIASELEVIKIEIGEGCAPESAYQDLALSYVLLWNSMRTDD